MTKQEKKEYIKNILQMVLTGTEENFKLAETLIGSLNLDYDFMNYAEKEIKVLRVKKSFLESQVIFDKNGTLKSLQTAAEIGSDIINIKFFVSNHLDSEKIKNPFKF